MDTIDIVCRVIAYVLLQPLNLLGVACFVLFAPPAYLCRAMANMFSNDRYRESAHYVVDMMFILPSAFLILLEFLSKGLVAISSHRGGSLT
jgi:hypothetical protein